MYSQLIGSFERTGNFPLEANYIFKKESDLKAFFEQDPSHYQILHKGLFKIVESDEDGQQALYWVTSNGNKLEFNKLISFSSIKDLKDELAKLDAKIDKEIADRKQAIEDVYGTNDPSQITYNSILALSNAIKALQNKLTTDEADIANLKVIVKAIAGTNIDDVVKYLSTLTYQNLTELSNTLDAFLNKTDSTNPNINTWIELEKFLDGFTDSDNLKKVLDKLVNDLLGNPLPTLPFRTLRGIEDFVRTLKSQSENTDANLQTELDQTQVGVGLSGDGSYQADQTTTYLKNATSVMNALQILDGLINDAINNTNIQVADTNTIDLSINKQKTSTTLSGQVKISQEVGNGIIAKSDGICLKFDGDIDKGVLTIKINDNIVFQKSLGVSSIIDGAFYDADNEQLVFVCKLNDGTTNNINIPVGALITEWEVDNNGPTNVVNLTRTRVVSGTDKLSADVRLSTDVDNILVKDANSLLVKGTSDNIVHTDGRKVNVILDAINTTTDSLNSQLQQEVTERKIADNNLQSNITTEVTDRKNADSAIQSDLNAHTSDFSNPHKVTAQQIGLGKVDNTQDTDKPVSTPQKTYIDNIKNALQADINTRATSNNPTFTGNVLLTDIPAANDNSTKVPSTNWVNNAIASQAGTLLNTHTTNYNNPHKVDKGQVGLGNVDNTADADKPISTATQAALDEKAPIENPILKGVVMLEDLIDPNDASQRAATTAWVKGAMQTTLAGGIIKKVMACLATPDDVTMGYATSNGEPILKIYTDSDAAAFTNLIDILNYHKGSTTDSIDLKIEPYKEDSEATNYTISADLKIDKNINDNSDIKLSISSDGLSATFQVGEYD